MFHGTTLQSSSLQMATVVRATCRQPEPGPGRDRGAVHLGCWCGEEKDGKASEKQMGLSENRVYSPKNSHLIGIMISKTIGFRGTLFSDTPRSTLPSTLWCHQNHSWDSPCWVRSFPAWKRALKISLGHSPAMFDDTGGHIQKWNKPQVQMVETI